MCAHSSASSTVMPAYLPTYLATSHLINLFRVKIVQTLAAHIFHRDQFWFVIAQVEIGLS
jgi:hypothetical protein